MMSEPVATNPSLPAPGAPGFVEQASGFVRRLLTHPQFAAEVEALSLEAFAATTDQLADTAEADRPKVQRVVWDWLDLLRRPPLLGRLATDDRDAWAARILRLVEASDFTVGPLFRHRAETYGSKILFETGGVHPRSLSWRQAASRVDWYARGLWALDPENGPGPLALLTENRIEGALIDLACLTSGIQNVMLPANATHRDVRYMLEHSGARTIVVSGAEQWSKVHRHRSRLPQLKWAFSIEAPTAGAQGIEPIDALRGHSSSIGADFIETRSLAVSPDDRATTMYTSGTTGEPKGICFSHRNLVFKRFARALALPEIGVEDVFVSYLPLFHTFGRFLEMLGCVFWGARYAFLTDPARESLIESMRQNQPTVFISIPKKWIELYDEARPEDEGAVDRIRSLTGGRLRYGISAAGHLDASVFRFFQQSGIELMSGFGMTEATGGITMTPPGSYRDDSLGLPLPGIETRIAEDGELLIRGPYVMQGYLDPPDGNTGYDEEGWFATGDLMERNRGGHFRLVDRKKEIYKNIRGETVAPQRVEKLFRQFESVGRVFLVGDHRPYNTVLIWPNPEFTELDLSPELPQTLDHFRSVVVSVNQFLSPFERIVDFSLIDRDLDPAREELTAKGTPRRRTVENNFQNEIQQLYRRTSLEVGGVDISFPNWLLQALGLTARGLSVDGDRLLLRRGARELTVRKRGRGLAQVGSCIYRYRPGTFPIGGLVSAPRLWLGNEGLVEFLKLDLDAYQRPGRDAEGIQWRARRHPVRVSAQLLRLFENVREQAEPTLEHLHTVGLMLAAGDELYALEAVDWLERVLRTRDSSLSEPCRVLLRRAASGAAMRVRRRAFEILAPIEREGRFHETTMRFLASPGRLLDRATRRGLTSKRLSGVHLEILRKIALERTAESAPTPERDEGTADLLRLLAEYGATHPTQYRGVRTFLERMRRSTDRAPLCSAAERAVGQLTDGFRRWLGSNPQLAVDPEDGEEYGWKDVVAFDDDVAPANRRRILSSLKETGMLREAVFLFSAGALIQLSDIPIGGVWARLIATRSDKSVYRITVQTRWQGSFDFAVNLNHSRNPRLIQDEMHWLIVCGDAQDRSRLVEDFGGYWPEQDLWTEEYIPGETLDIALKRLSRRRDGDDRLTQSWPFFAWTALAAYVDFWDRSGRRFEIADAGMNNVVVPSHDYQLGARLVSIAARKPHVNIVQMLITLRDGFLRPAEGLYPQLTSLLRDDAVPGALVEVLGEREGLALLDELLENPPQPIEKDLEQSLTSFLSKVKQRGYLPMRLYFAGLRYRRWIALSPNATLQARAEMITELYETYGLSALASAYPATRVRFFLFTVLREGDPELKNGLGKIVEEPRSGERLPDELIDAIADLRSGLDVDEEADYFLTRLSFPHLRPQDAAGFEHLEREGRSAAEVVVQLEDAEGGRFRIRHALNPKEIGRLHRLFLQATLDVRFQPEHRFLVAMNERDRLIGGIFYDFEEDAHSAHLEKIVVAERFRKLGVADALMNEFFHRMRAFGARTVTTGFFRPEFFYRHGFRVGRKNAGLVKTLDEKKEPSTTTPPAAT